MEAEELFVILKTSTKATSKVKAQLWVSRPGQQSREANNCYEESVV